jgi:4-hydroxybenzoate polyprenyltransferase
MKPQSDIPDVPLCVAVDGTLIKTNLLIEGFFAMIKERPLTLLKVPFWLLRGKASFKARIAEQSDIEVDVLPYDKVLLERLRVEKEKGRLLVLVTSAPYQFARRVQSHLSMFGEIHATEDGINLSGARKKDRLVQRFGEQGFDYLGRNSDDVPIWAAARKSWLVGASPAVRRAAYNVGDVTEEFAKKGGYVTMLVTLVKAMRLHQWLKNILIFVPLIASHRIGDLALVADALVAFIAFGLCASSVYLLNDLLDLSADRHHPRKRQRAFASGALPVRNGLFLIPALIAASVLLGVTLLPLEFLAVLGAYFVMTLVYSFWAKERPVVDVLFLTALYSMRLVAGAAATTVELSFWLLAFSIFLFLSLALIKRYSEMFSVREAGLSYSRGRGYSTDDMSLIQSMGVAAGYMAVLVLALYVHSAEVNRLYGDPRILWTLCVVLLFWISRAWLKSSRGEMPDDPVVFAAKDRFSQLSAGIVAVTLWLAA